MWLWNTHDKATVGTWRDGMHEIEIDVSLDNVSWINVYDVGNLLLLTQPREMQDL